MSIMIQACKIYYGECNGCGECADKKCRGCGGTVLVRRGLCHECAYDIAVIELFEDSETGLTIIEKLEKAKEEHRLWLADNPNGSEIPF